MKTPDGARSVLASVWHDVNELGKGFDSIYFSYVNRGANGVAHCCAKFANPVDNFCTWERSIPNFLSDALSYDCNPAFVI